MGQSIELVAQDGHRLSAYAAEPSVKPCGGIVVIQEIFGVTRHIKAVVEQYAAAGFAAAAPALFDRVEQNVDVPYDDMSRAVGYMHAVDPETALLDVAAAAQRLNGAVKVGVVGFCWGGTLAYLAAARLNISAAVAYYGGGIKQHVQEKPRAPVMFHFGEKDSHIPLSAVDEVRRAYPAGLYFMYPAGHGFNCTDRASYEPASAELAMQRTLGFLHERIG